MRIIIHAGMHKTGSSSIQKTFSEQPLPGFNYMPGLSANHSTLVALLFHEPVESYHSFRRNNRSTSELMEQRTLWLDRLSRELASDSKRIPLISAEFASTPKSRLMLQRMQKFLVKEGFQPQVYAYVRPPCSFMTSAFQQRLKGGDVPSVSGCYPQYRERFEQLDQVFGRDNVQLRRFDPAAFPNGDVVKDFADWIGMNLDLSATQRINESLSLEAIALLYAQRILGSDDFEGFAGATRAFNRFIVSLSTVGSTKFALSQEAILPVLAQNSDDLDWIETRMGEPLIDRPKPDEKAISSEKDLMAIAIKSLPQAEEVLLEQIRFGGQKARLGRVLDNLMNIHVSRVRRTISSPAPGDRRRGARGA